MSVGDRQVYWIAFNCVPGIGPARLSTLLEHFGTLQAAWEADAYTLSEAGLDRRSTESVVETRRELSLEKVLTELDRLDVQVLTWLDETYPRLLLEIDAPPPVLYVRGSLTEDDEWALAVVGTRGATRYGKEVTRTFAGELAAAGVTIVSGLALGIDRLAHEVALDAGGRTIAVLGSGVDRLYPARNRKLAVQAMDNGAVVSDYPLGTPPEASNFPPRNRIISGLSLGTLVVEAGKKSGALITSNFAVEHGREVFAVPGSIFNPKSVGTNRLIRDGAMPVLEPDDIVRALNLERAMPQRQARETLPETDNEIEAAVLEALSHEPTHIDQIGDETGLTAATISSTLAMMELKGLVRASGGMTYVRAR